MRELAGRVAVITGGASGIGRGVALALAKRAARIVIADINVERGAATAQDVEALGGAARFVDCDVTSDASVEDLRKQALEAFGRVDILMNNVGVLAAGDFEDIPLSAWDRCLRVNLLSCVRVTQAFLPELRAAGARAGAHIVNTGSLAALFANEPKLTPYGASKAALVSLTETLAVTLRPDNIGVTCLCPGMVPSNIGEHVSVYGEGGGLGVFASRHVPVRSADQIGELVVEAILNDRFLVTSGAIVQRVQQMRAADPDRFVASMAKFFETGEDLAVD
jgi:NAD(P)-dependent dehydrogenase (short-subunit alcohol dehydrogenase family)